MKLKNKKFLETQKNSFNKIAQHSDSNSYTENKALESKYSLIQSIIRKKKNPLILDYGCGFGGYFIKLTGDAKQIFSVDISEKSLELLDTECKKREIKNINIINQENFKFSDYQNYFDFIILVNVCHHIAELDALIWELRNVLKDDGELIVFEFNPLNLFWIPFFIMIKQFRIHLNSYYFRSNIMSLKNLFKRNELKIKNIKKYAFLPTSLYNISSIFSKENHTVNKTPVLKMFSAFNIFILMKQGKKLIESKTKNKLNITNISEAIMYKRYRESYSDDQANLYENPIIKTIFNLGHKYIAKKISKNNGTILDIGSGMGYHINFERIDNTRKYIAMDIDETLLSKIDNHKVIKLKSSCEKIKLAKNSVDIVIASHILEHITDLKKGLSEINRVLKPGGKIAVVLPCDPGILWTFLAHFTPSRNRLKKIGFDYDIIMKFEHINTFNECRDELNKYFKIRDSAYFPILIKNYNLNLIAGFVFTKTQ